MSCGAGLLLECVLNFGPSQTSKNLNQPKIPGIFLVKISNEPSAQENKIDNEVFFSMSNSISTFHKV